MLENIFVATRQSEDSASTLACQQGGLVLSIDSATISNGLEICELWTATPLVWIQNNQSYFTSYGEVEKALTSTGIMHQVSLISEGSFAISASASNATSANYDIYDTVALVAGKLSENKNLNVMY